MLIRSRCLLVIWGLSLALGAKPALAQEPASDDSQETTENSESLALEAARVQGEHCADAASNRKTEGLRSISTVSNTWVRVSEQYDRSGDNYLLYWRGVLAQCMDQESRAYDDLKGFLEQVGDSSLWAGLVRDARRRIRLLERKTGAARGGAARARLRNPRPVTGLLLCGLYGEPPELLEQLVDIGSARPGVVGLDLAGGPAPGHSWGMSDYARPFRRAADLGLGTTVHAGEGRPPAEIRVAIEQLGAQRIGHGTTLLEDPAVLDLVLERSTTIEACPTSNLHVGAIASVDEHPLPRWLEAGVKVCVCTDNTLLSAVDAGEELRRAGAIPGMNETLLERVVATGHEAAFARGSGADAP